jgi:hypothetical protein
MKPVRGDRRIATLEPLPPLTGLRAGGNASCPGAHAAGLIPDAPAGLDWKTNQTQQN